MSRRYLASWTSRVIFMFLVLLLLLVIFWPGDPNANTFEGVPVVIWIILIVSALALAASWRYGVDWIFSAILFTMALAYVIRHMVLIGVIVDGFWQFIFDVLSAMHAVLGG